MSKLLILGGNGMLGSMLASYFIKKNYYVDVSLSKTQFLPYTPNDVLYQNFFERCKINFSTYDYVINCVGAIKQKNYTPEELYILNGILPQNLALKAIHEGSRLIHYSSDCVFSGNTSSPYSKYDLCDAEDNYGKSKFLGETTNGIVIRSSIIGPAKDLFGLFEWFKNQSNSIRGFVDHHWSGMTTLEMAKQTHDLIISNASNGLYQFASPAVNKYDLLCQINKIFHLNKTIIKHNTTIVNRCLISDKAISSLEVQLKELKQYCHE